ncbi:MAG: hypothetical protein ACI8WM_000879 [Burkholderiaceae bacterium]
MRKITAGLLLLTPHITINTRDNRNTHSLTSNLIGKNKDDAIALAASKNLLAPRFSSLLKKSGAWLAYLDRSLAIGLPGADAANTVKPNNPFEELSYNKGDDAESIDEFSKAVRKQYSVFSNKNAYDPKKFNDAVIMIYGEYHSVPLLPSIRNGRGALLLESPDLDRCLEKHRLHPENICKNIDLFDSHLLAVSTYKLYQELKTLVLQLDPTEHREIEKKSKAKKASATALIEEMMDFVDAKYMIIYSSTNKNTQKKLDDSYRSVISHYAENDSLVWASLQERDVGMVSEAKKVIAALKNGEATTIIVGNLHVKAIYNALAIEFPDHAIVACFINKHLAALGRDGRREFLKDINGDPVDTRSKITKTEL